MIQQTLRLFETAPNLEVAEPHFQEHHDPLLQEIQQLFQTDGSEAELVALIQKTIDAIHELCDQSH